MTSPTADELKALRMSIGLSQSALSRLSRVPRWKICACELGDSDLTSDEQKKIAAALQAESERLRSLPAHINFGTSDVPRVAEETSVV